MPEPKTLKAMFDKAVLLELDRERKLMLTTYAWQFLEECYGSLAGALRGYAEMMAGHKALTHTINWLYALLQEEIRQANKTRTRKNQETLTREDVEVLLTPHLSDMAEIKLRITETIQAYYPVQDPLQPVAKTASRGTGGGPGSSSPTSTAGTTTDS